WHVRLGVVVRRVRFLDLVGDRHEPLERLREHAEDAVLRRSWEDELVVVRLVGRLPRPSPGLVAVLAVARSSAALGACARLAGSRLVLLVFFVVLVFLGLLCVFAVLLLLVLRGAAGLLGLLVLLIVVVLRRAAGLLGLLVLFAVFGRRPHGPR